MTDPVCHSCGKNLGLDRGAKIGRGECCEHCGADVRVCKNCTHYNPKAYNECKETQAERVLEKAKSNFCDYFFLDLPAYLGTVPATPGMAKASSPDGQQIKSEKELAKERFDALFKS